MPGERRLDLERGDVLAGAADDVLQPVDEMQRAVVAAPRRVTGVEPAVAPRFGGGLVVLEIAGEEAAPGIRAFLPDQHFSGLFLKGNFQGTRRKSKAPCS